MPPLVMPTLALTSAGARLALDAALGHGQELGGAFNVAVCDDAGRLLAFARMDGAFAASGDIARDKAWTVANFAGLAGDDLYDAIAEEAAVLEGIAHRDRVAAFGGGVALRIGDTLVGAIGVSGGSAAQDKQVAQAGADALMAACGAIDASTTPAPASATSKQGELP